MAKILGLDLGTNSIGWAIVDKVGTDFLLVDKGVRIFSEGVNIEAKTNSESSKAAQRTNYRSGRKLKYRRKIRKIDLLKVLSDNNLCPKLSDEELNVWRYKKIYPQNDDFRKWLSTDTQENEIDRKKQRENPYYFRFKSSKELLDLKNRKDRYDLGRSFYHIAQRRGFLSNRLDSSDNSIIEDKKSEITSIINEANSVIEFTEFYNDFLSSYDKDDSNDKPLFSLLRAFNLIFKDNVALTYIQIKEKLDERLNKKEFLGKVKKAISDLSEKMENSGCTTLGEYFYLLYAKGEKIRGEYTHREDHYLTEFEIICNKQNLSSEFSNQIQEAIFFQRPLKSQKGLVAKCPLENRKACVPVSHPDFEEFRMYSYLNNIKIKTQTDEKLRVLNKEERTLIEPLFYRKSKANFDFEEIAKKLTPKYSKSGYFKDKNTKDFDVFFNYTLGSNVAGCPTIANFRDVFGVEWKEYFSTHFNKPNKNGEKKTEDEIVDAIWHVLFRFDKEDKLKEFALENLSCDEKIAIKFSKIKLKQDYGSLSLKAIRNILPYLKEGLIYSHSVFLANMKNVLPKEIWNNEGNRKVINNEIFSIIENYNEYSTKVDIVNGLIKNSKKEQATWNSNNEFVVEAYHKALKSQIESFFGLRKWDTFSVENQREILEECFELFSNQMKLNSGRGEFVKKQTIDEILKVFLSDNFNINQDDLKKLYHPSAIEVYKTAKRSDEDGKLYLGSPLISSIKNPMAMRALHQLRKVINQLVKDDLIDEGTIVHIEMPRELNSANERVAIRQWQEDLKNKRKRHADEIKEIYKEQFHVVYEPTDDELLKYQLWIEQNRICLYTNKTINITDFIGSNPKFDIEHTIPRSRSLDNSQINKTLCCSIYNRDVKKDKIPFECKNHSDILPNIRHWYARYKDLEDQIKQKSKQVKAASIKEIRDKYIQQRTKLKFEYIYFKKKYATFTFEEIPEGFKNSQSVDIGIISKYGNLFLKTLFNKVFPIKGKTTANLREMWGLEEKTRVNHAHHAKDAIVVACCTRDINDALANYYHDLEQYEFYGKPKPSFAHRIPWKGFNDDVKEFENNTLISHHTPDVLPIQSKKAIRKRGIIQRNEKGEIKYKQGDTVRGALHKESFYGAIKREEISKKTGQPEEIIKYVLRKAIEKFSDSDIKNIVDDKVKQIVENGREQEKVIKKEIDEIKKHMKNVKEEEEQTYKDAIQLLENKIKNELYVLPNQNGNPVPIKKIRYYTGDVTNPLLVKKHRDVSRHEHKQHYFAKNDGNYCYAIYEGIDRKGKLLTDFKVINNFDAGKYYKSKENNHKYPLELNIEDKNANILNLKFLLKTGTMVLFYKDFKDEIWELDNLDLSKRLYKTVAIEADGRIQFRLHSTAKSDGELEKASSLNFEKANEKLRLSKSALTILVEGFDFIITSVGKIQKI
jgi:CRISPR-associated endonuclease Csn1